MSESEYCDARAVGLLGAAAFAISQAYLTDDAENRELSEIGRVLSELLVRIEGRVACQVEEEEL